jgi:branched-chain amino acid transport system permease protein
VIELLQTTLDGVMVGGGYALLALGFTLTFGVMRRLNLSYGASILIGVYGGTLLHASGAGILAVLAATVAGAALAGLYVERLCFRALPATAAVASMVSSYAVWMQLQELATLVLPRHTYAFPGFGDAPIEFGPLLVRIEPLMMVLAAALLAGLVAYVLYRTRAGLALRATVESRVAAQLVGIDVARVTLWTFVAASAVGGLAGFLIAVADAQVTPMLGMWTTMKGLVAMMLGGLGSIPGAIAGGLALGVFEAHAQAALGPQLRDLLAYGLLFAVLVCRPGGLFGQRRVVAGAAAESR